jgi:hypothetical protein
MWQQGSDTGNSLISATASSKARIHVSADYGFSYGDAVKQNGINANLWVAYEWKENFFHRGQSDLSQARGAFRDAGDGGGAVEYASAGVRLLNTSNWQLTISN